MSSAAALSVSVPSSFAPWEAVWLSSLGWQPSLEQAQAFHVLYQAVIAGNRQLNLTRITEPSAFWEKHLWDSLRGIIHFLRPAPGPLPGGATVTLPIAPPFPDTGQVIDIGTGAGFPGLPIAIACPHWQVTLLDSTRKKLAFVDRLRSMLGLTNVRSWVERVEAIGHQSEHREQYDLAVIRAVGPATVCAEYALPLVKLGGWVVLYRGNWTASEADALFVASEQLGGSLAVTERFQTPLSGSLRHLVYVQKLKPTPLQFPREVGIPAQSPLA
ncbi:16S rRNA (guanine(527)-N(7))-methyltransferase RsmG [Trichothermofontia sp.]